MAGAKKLSPDEIRRLFDLNVETGELRWTSTASQGRLTNRVAGSHHASGYRQIKIGKSSYLAHRVVWAIVYGEWPSGPVDHIDGVRSNNAVSNLRLASASQNMQNLAVTGLKSASGLAGAVHVPGTAKRRDKWQARIRINGVQKYLGVFSSPQEAHAVYLSAKSRLHPYFSRS